ncbi:uncharacterized protein LOC106659324 [Trichogramma pretiosum]|uniref:uncharacterized protein LOC106659324 n=1 Tax=Trichogramma pretiosum TaxID=7493 RepID=UPI0006C9DD31|nr:uncharacterized protein LOC106659324 [Trichogramma pretiosum]
MSLNYTSIWKNAIIPKGMTRGRLLYEELSRTLDDGEDFTDFATSTLKKILSHFTNLDKNEILMYAVKYERMVIVDCFAKAETKISNLPQFTKTAIHEIDRKDNYYLLCNIYDDVNYIDENGYSHFHAACKFGNDGAVQRFIDQGTHINITCSISNVFDHTPLDLAVFYEHVQVVRLLLEAGARVDDCDMFGMTPLNRTCLNIGANVFCDLEIIRTLVDFKSDINLKDNIGNSSIVNLFSGDIISPYHKEVLQILLKNDVHVADVDKVAQRILSLADPNEFYKMQHYFKFCERNRNTTIIEMIQILLERGVDINAKGPNNDSLLDLAIFHNNYDLVKFFLERGANMDGVKIEAQLLYSLSRIPKNLEMIRNVLNIIDLLEENRRGFQMNNNLHLTLGVIKFFIQPNPSADFIFDTDDDSDDSDDGISTTELGPLTAGFVQFLNNPGFDRNFGTWIAIIEEGKMFMDMKKLDHLQKWKQNALLSKTKINKRTKISKYINKAKSTKMSNGHSLLELCTSSPKQTYSLLRNSEYESIVNSEDFMEKFGPVGGVVRAYITESIVKRYLARKGQEFLRLLIQFNLPDLCCENIIKYLDDDELFLMCQSVVF